MSLCIFNNKVNLINLLLDNGAYIDYKIPNRGKWISYLQYAIICQSFESFKVRINKIQKKKKKKKKRNIYKFITSIINE